MFKRYSAMCTPLMCTPLGHELCTTARCVKASSCPALSCALVALKQTKWRRAAAGPAVLAYQTTQCLAVSVANHTAGIAKPELRATVPSTAQHGMKRYVSQEQKVITAVPFAPVPHLISSRELRHDLSKHVCLKQSSRCKANTCENQTPTMLLSSCSTAVLS